MSWGMLWAYHVELKIDIMPVTSWFLGLAITLKLWEISQIAVDTCHFFGQEIVRFDGKVTCSTRKEVTSGGTFLHSSTNMTVAVMGHIT